MEVLRMTGPKPQYGAMIRNLPEQDWKLAGVFYVAGAALGFCAVGRKNFPEREYKVVRIYWAA